MSCKDNKRKRHFKNENQWSLLITHFSLLITRNTNTLWEPYFEAYYLAITVGGSLGAALTPELCVAVAWPTSLPDGR